MIKEIINKKKITKFYSASEVMELMFELLDELEEHCYFKIVEYKDIVREYFGGKE